MTSNTSINADNYTEYLPDGWYALSYKWGFSIDPLDGKQYLACKANTDFNTRFIPFYAHGGTITIKARAKYDGYSYSIYVYKATRNGDSFTAGSNLITATVTSTTDQDVTTYTLPEDGYYALSGENGAYILSITNTYEAAVTTTYTVSGSVIDADGNPVEGATVSLPGANVQTDTEGKYSIEGIEDGTYDLTVSKEGYQNATASVTVSGGDLTVDPITLQLEKWSIAGYVQDSNYTHIPGAAIQLYDGDTMLAESTTNETGNYSFEIPAVEKTYTLKIQAKYFKDYSIAVKVIKNGLNNKVCTRNPMLDAILVSFSLAVKDTWNQPIHGANVRINGETLNDIAVYETGNSGTYLLRNKRAFNLKDYEYTWTVSADGYENASGTVVFNGENVYAEATLIPTGTTVISGKVTDTDGNALADAHVSLTIGDATTAVATVDTNTEGYYSFARTDLEAPASIEVSLTNYESDTKEIAVITPNANNVCNFALTPLVYHFTATVKNQSGDVLPEATVTFDGNALTGENGVFTATIAAADAAGREIPVEIACEGYVTQNVNLSFTDNIDATYTLVKANAGESDIVIEVYDQQNIAINNATVSISNEAYSVTATFDSDGVYLAKIPNVYKDQEFTIKVEAHSYKTATKNFIFTGAETSETFTLEEEQGNGVNEILDELDGEAKVFTIDGLRIEVKKGERLPAGFYIVNGRKLIVR